MATPVVMPSGPQAKGVPLTQSSDTVSDETGAVARRKARAALVSILASAGLTAAKLVVGVLTGSLAILSEALHSLLDVGATVITYVAVRLADRPADDDHHYGHAKIESLAALLQTGLLMGAGGWIFYEAVTRLWRPHGAFEVEPVAVGVIVVAIVVDFFRARTLEKMAEETSSQALEADALHFSSDMWASAVVLVGLGLVWLGYPWADAVAAMVVAVFVFLAGWGLGKRTIDTLTDAAPLGTVERVRALVSRLPGVSAIDKLRVRPAGSVLFIEIGISVPRTLPTGELMALKATIEREVEAAFPTADVTVSALPRALDDETVIERVMTIARDKRLAVHHITVQRLGERLCLSIDLEVDGRLALDAAHAIATDLEDEIVLDIGEGVEVDTHIEPMQVDDLNGVNCADEDIARMTRLLEGLAQQRGDVREIHNVRARRSGEGVIVNFHCRMAPSTRVDLAHLAIDDIERGLRNLWPDVRRVVGHVEPAGIPHAPRRVARA